jgi:hypothetical protein
LIAAGGGLETVKLRDVGTRQELLNLSGTGGALTSARVLEPYNTLQTSQVSANPRWTLRMLAPRGPREGGAWSPKLFASLRLGVFALNVNKV